MKLIASVAFTLVAVMIASCAGSGAHEQTLAELDNLKKQSAAAQEELAQNKKALEKATARAAALEKEKQEEAARLQNRIGELEEENKRSATLSASQVKELESQAAAGGIVVEQGQGQATITVIDRILFDSGQDVIAPSGIKILERVSDILKNVKGKRARIEGHADSMPIGDNLRDKFLTNWELSTARATSVVHYLEQSGIDRTLLSAAGYADTKPVAENETREGRAANRRIEITLYPKDLSEVVK